MNRRSIETISAAAIALSALFALDQARAQDVARVERIGRGEAAIEIVRDAGGVPHVFADDFQALWHGAGYATAEDRLWTMDRLRRDALGRYAEIGLWRIEPGLTREQAIEHDRLARRLHHGDEERRRMLLWLDPEVVALLEAYADGVNAFIAVARERGRLPPEYARLEVEPIAWRATDSLAIGELFVARPGEDALRGIAARLAYDRLHDDRNRREAEQLFDELFFVGDAGGPTIVPRGAPTASTIVSGVGVVDGNDLAPGSVDRDLLHRAAGLLLEEGRLARRLGSIADGGGLLLTVGGAHLTARRGLTLVAPPPSADARLYHAIHLRGPASMEREGEIDAAGLAFPGLPALVHGFNRWGAWATGLDGGSEAEIYIERLDPAAPDRHLFNGVLWSFIEREERIEIWSESEDAPSVVEVVRGSIHGPVLAESSENRQALVVGRPTWQVWTYSPVHPYLLIAGMTSRDDFQTAARLFWSNHHLVYADRESWIGYQWVGRIPMYPRRHDARLPIVGDGGREWRDHLSFERLPFHFVRSRPRDTRADDRPSHFLSWANRPIELWPAWEGAIAPGASLRDRFRRGEPVEAEAWIEFVARAAASDEPLAEALRPLLDRVAGRPEIEADPTATAALALALEPPSGEIESPAAAAIFHRFADALARRLFAETFPFLFEPPGEEIDPPAMLSLMNRVLVDANHRRRAISARYLDGRSIEEVAFAAAIDAVGALRESQGPDPNSWRKPVDLRESRDRWAAGPLMFGVEVGEPMRGILRAPTPEGGQVVRTIRLERPDR